MIRHLFLYVFALLSFGVCTAQAQKPVLVAGTNHGKQYNLDSISYKHSNGRQTVLHFNGAFSQYRFDTAYYWGSTIISQMTFAIPKSREYCTYDHNDSLLITYYDTYDPATKAYIKKTRQRYVYNIYGNIDSSLTEKYSDTANRYITDYVKVNTYNQQQQLIHRDEIIWHTGYKIWMHTGVVDSFRYDNMGRLAEWKDTYSFLVHNAGTYTYNANGLKILEEWTYLGVNSTRMEYDYYPNNLLKSYTQLLWDDNLLLWVPEYKTLYNYNGNGHCTETLDMRWDKNSNTFIYDLKTHYTYNGDEQLTKREYEQWVANNWKPYDEPYYYYYAIPTAIATTTAAQTGISLYPIPATSRLHIGFEVKGPANLTITITDMQGRVAKQWNDKTTGQYQKNIAVQDMAAGQYTLQVKGDNMESIAKQFIIVK